MITRKHTASKWTAVYALSLLLILVGMAPAYSAAGDASEFVANLGSQAIRIMKDLERSTIDRQQRFDELMRKDFDLPRIAQTVLGRHWKQASDVERLNFTNAFADYLSRMYSERFADYSPDSFRVISQHANSETMTVVSSEITRLATGEPVSVDWNVVKTFDGFRVIDMGAGGVSLSTALREEFSSVIQKVGGVANLTSRLQTKVHELASSAK